MTAPGTLRAACLGGLFFQRDLVRFGIEAAHIPLTRPEALFWDDVVQRAGFTPDLVIYLDRSLPPPLLGVESFPCLTAFYCIDSHIHSWYPAYAQGFDLCAVSLKDHLPRFGQRLSTDRLLWLPPFADRHHLPSPAEKRWDLLFAGTVDPETTPGRHAFLRKLKNRFPGLEVRRGRFPELFPQARLALNVAERGDLNFRVFEALACGACLLTPRLEQGQDKLFRHGEHLFTYDPEDIEGLLAMAQQLLADEPLRLRVAEAGRAEVEARHRPWHRAEALARMVRSVDAGETVAVRRAAAADIRRRWMRLVYLHWAESAGDAALAARYLAASRAVD